MPPVLLMMFCYAGALLMHFLGYDLYDLMRYD